MCKGNSALQPSANVSPIVNEPAGISAADYRLGPEDVIDVFVWKEPDLSTSVVIRPDGKISLPLANELVASGKVKAPIVIGRDHLDCGSVASPNRETEAMRDGTDAVADWPILNALVNAVNGASWVSFHHGGGVGIGYSLHAGQVIVADGTDAAAKRLSRVLTSDPGMGVVRHVDAGYPEAIAVAKERGVKIPGVTL